MKTLGIDLSEWNGLPDFKKIKEGRIDFAILRIGYGKESSQIDKSFIKNYNGAKAAGLPIGGYWYSYATSTEDAKKEAETCLELIKGKTFEYPIYYDIEEQRQFNLGKEKVTKIAEMFLKTLERAGYYVGLYSYKNALDSYFTDEIKKRFAVWIAHYTDAADYSKIYGMHQYTSSGKLKEIDGKCDFDYCFIDYPKIIKQYGFNGFKKQVKTSSTKTVAEIAKEVIQGKWGNGDARKRKLTNAGYNYREVQKKVNELI